MKLKSLAALTAPMALTAASFTRQRNADVFGCADIGAHFKNRYSSNICFVEGEGGGDGDGGQGGEGSGEIKFASQEAFNAAVMQIIQAQGGAAGKDEGKGGEGEGEGHKESLFEKRQKEEAAKKQKEAEVKQIENAVLFDSQFDTFLRENAKMFPDTAKSIRADVSKIEENQVKRASLMAATAAKEFFSNEQNIKILAKEDQDVVSREITGKRYESEIDGTVAWELVKRAIYNHNLKNKHDAMRDTSGAGTGKYGYDNLDKWLSGIFPERVKDLDI